MIDGTGGNTTTVLVSLNDGGEKTMSNFSKIVGFSPLLDALSISWGRIYVDGFVPISITNQKQAKNLLKDSLDRNIITADEAQRLDTEMTLAGLEPNLRAIFNKVIAYWLPQGFKPSLRFEKCGCGVPLPHGDVYKKDKMILSNVFTLGSALRHYINEVEKNTINAHEAISVIQQMTVAGLPADDNELAEMYKALSEDVRREYKETLANNRLEAILLAILDRLM